jgi:hypothetical protein
MFLVSMLIPFLLTSKTHRTRRCFVGISTKLSGLKLTHPQNTRDNANKIIRPRYIIIIQGERKDKCALRELTRFIDSDSKKVLMLFFRLLNTVTKEKYLLNFFRDADDNKSLFSYFFVIVCIVFILYESSR